MNYKYIIYLLILLSVIYYLININCQNKNLEHYSIENKLGLCVSIDNQKNPLSIDTVVTRLLDTKFNSFRFFSNSSDNKIANELVKKDTSVEIIPQFYRDTSIFFNNKTFSEKFNNFCDEWANILTNNCSKIVLLHEPFNPLGMDLYKKLENNGVQLDIKNLLVIAYNILEKRNLNHISLIIPFSGSVLNPDVYNNEYIKKNIKDMWNFLVEKKSYWAHDNYPFFWCPYSKTNENNIGCLERESNYYLSFYIDIYNTIKKLNEVYDITILPEQYIVGETGYPSGPSNINPYATLDRSWSYFTGVVNGVDGKVDEKLINKEWLNEILNTGKNKNDIYNFCKRLKQVFLFEAFDEDNKIQEDGTYTDGPEQHFGLFDKNGRYKYKHK